MRDETPAYAFFCLAVTLVVMTVLGDLIRHEVCAHHWTNPQCAEQQGLPR